MKAWYQAWGKLDDISWISSKKKNEYKKKDRAGRKNFAGRDDQAQIAQNKKQWWSIELTVIVDNNHAERKIICCAAATKITTDTVKMTAFTVPKRKLTYKKK